MPQLTNGTTSLPYYVKKSGRSKQLRITVGLDGVVVTAPSFLPEQEIMSFVEKKKAWIFKKVADYRLVRGQIRETRKFITGDAFPFRGEDLALRVIEYEGRQTKVLITDNHLAVYISRHVPQDMRREEIRTKLEQWYNRMAKDTFIESADFYKTKLDVEYNTIRVKNQKTRWGSCSKKGNLNFNWKLVMAPIDVIDYVVVHELCHLVHMNHSKDFWQLVASQIPDYKQKKRWLRENGIGLGL